MTPLKTMARLAQAVISLLIAALPAAHAQEAGEYQVKALFIYNFAKFVEWPVDAFKSPHESLTVCIAGQDPFGRDIDEAVKGRSVNSRELLVKRLSGSDDPKGCHVLFWGAGEKKHAKQLAESISASPVLTIGDGNLTDSNVIINFSLDAGKVRFDINLEASERARLKISSKLLSLARSVKESSK